MNKNKFYKYNNNQSVVALPEIVDRSMFINVYKRDSTIEFFFDMLFPLKSYLTGREMGVCKWGYSKWINF